MEVQEPAGGDVSLGLLFSEWQGLPHLGALAGGRPSHGEGQEGPGKTPWVRPLWVSDRSPAVQARQPPTLSPRPSRDSGPVNLLGTFQEACAHSQSPALGECLFDSKACFPFRSLKGESGDSGAGTLLCTEACHKLRSQGWLLKSSLWVKPLSASWNVAFTCNKANVLMFVFL